MSELSPDQGRAMPSQSADYSTDSVSRPGPITSQVKTEPGVRVGLEEACPVCGDRVSGYHYGLLTCESCKGFFKRTVQNNKLYSCGERQRCPMDVAQRKRCPFCRFQKCLSVGMRREAVRADRMRGGRNKFGPLYRRDRLLKQQKRPCHQSNSTPYRIKMESQPLQTTVLSDLPLPMPTTLSSEPFHQSPPLASSTGQSELPVLLDCTMNKEKGLGSFFMPHTGPYHSSPQGHVQGMAELPLRCAQVPAIARNPTGTEPCFLAELLRGEPEEAQICARVLASLQREQASRGKHDRLNTFNVMCKMADQTLFGLVEWARNCAFFKDLKVEDQMYLLHSCWSELLVLDHLHRQVAYGRNGSVYLVTGQQIEVSTILAQAGVHLSSLVSRSQDLVYKLRALQLDRQEFVCLKYLVLFNPDVKSLQERGQVEWTQERVNRALMEHTERVPAGHKDKFGQLLLKLPEVHSISLQAEDYLYQRHLLGDLPCNSLLTEMLHAKHT